MSDNQWDPTGTGKTQAPPDNVADMEKARIKADAKTARESAKKTAKEATSGDEGLSPVQMSEMLTLRMADHAFVSQVMPEPSERIAVVLSAGGKRRPIEFGADGVCRYIDMDTAAGVILRYCHRIKVDKRFFSYGMFEWRHAMAAANFWLHMMKTVPEPVAFRFADDPGPCFHRIPFTPKAGPTPLFDAYIERMTAHQRLPFMAWNGSLYVMEADRQQLVWLWGPGGDGKSTWARHLQRIFGPSSLSQATAPDPKRNKHCYVPYENKRLVTFGDLDDSRAIRLLKSLTGGDWLDADVKGGDVHNFNPVCKILVISNSQPSLSSQRAELRRPIIVEMLQGFERADPAYEAALWEERAAIAHKCLEAYALLCPKHGDIPQSSEAVEAAGALGSILDEEFEVRLVQLFNRNPNGHCEPTAFQNQLNCIEKWNRKTRLAFAEWLGDVKGIRKKQVRIAGERVWVYDGITAKDLRGGFGQ